MMHKKIHKSKKISCESQQMMGIVTQDIDKEQIWYNKLLNVAIAHKTTVLSWQMVTTIMIDIECQ